MARTFTEREVRELMAEAMAPLLKRIAELEAEISRLRVENERMQSQLAAARKNSSTSSKPPSSDFLQATATPDNDRKRGGRKRRRGGQPGHPRHERTPFRPERIDDTYEYFYTACPDCGGRLCGSREPDRVIQQAELVSQPIRVDEHRALAQWCASCRKTHRTTLPPEVVCAGLVGPRLTALVGYLKGACHASYTTVADFFGDVLGLPLSTGQLVKLTGKLTDALDPMYEELCTALPKQSYVGADETGHPENGRNLWTWCFHTPGEDPFALFRIDPSRGAEVIRQMLGAEFAGVLGCDYFSAYRKFLRETSVRMQFCWAHLIRDVRFLTTLPDQVTRRFGERLLARIGALFRAWHRRGTGSAAVSRRLARCRDAFLRIVRRPPRRAEARAIAQRFREHDDEYFQFLQCPNVEPTNNASERTERFVVIDRKITQGTRGQRGRRWCERIWTAVATCTRQGRSLFQFLLQAVHAHLTSTPPPSLLKA
jgi:transposase